MPPEVMQTALLDKWVIVPRKHTDKCGITTIIGKRYPIPKQTLECIANDYLFKGLEGYEKGYSYKFTGADKTEIKVTVERINEVKS